MTIKWLASAFVCTGLMYCGGGSGGGGGSGVDSNKTVASLSDAELMDLCEYFTGLEEQPERVIDCGNGQTITVGINPEDVSAAVADCVATAPDAPCPLTVGQAEACFEATAALSDDELCNATELPPECAPIFDQSCQ